jgi:hypothetical protein
VKPVERNEIKIATLKGLNFQYINIQPFQGCESSFHVTVGFAHGYSDSVLSGLFFSSTLLQIQFDVLTL